MTRQRSSGNAKPRRHRSITAYPSQSLPWPAPRSRQRSPFSRPPAGDSSVPAPSGIRAGSPRTSTAGYDHARGPTVWPNLSRSGRVHEVADAAGAAVNHRVWRGLFGVVRCLVALAFLTFLLESRDQSVEILDDALLLLLHRLAGLLLGKVAGHAPHLVRRSPTWTGATTGGRLRGEGSAQGRHDSNVAVPRTRRLLFMASPIGLDTRHESTHQSDRRIRNVTTAIDYPAQGFILSSKISCVRDSRAFSVALKHLLLHPDHFGDLVDDVDEALPLRHLFEDVLHLCNNFTVQPSSRFFARART